MTEELVNFEEVSNTETTFDNIVILKEFGNIVNQVKNEDLLQTVPKAKLRRIQWIPMFNHLKQNIFDEMVQEFSSMWEYENMSRKIEILEKQKEKFGDINEDQTLWRPQLGDVKAQQRAKDMSNLQKRKRLLESLAEEYEVKVNRLKNLVAAKRGYIKALQMDIQKYQKKNEDFVAKLNDRFENHNNLVKVILPDMADYDASASWVDKDM